MKKEIVVGGSSRVVMACKGDIIGVLILES
jgi:hypothetical protein